mmetsp:Transcript_14603/g.31837  ORF Transcript_14603/g.31837 Transcript_14603/m.31837 type:complete len:488 (-) Transcript_14603:875-2338(-)|eukprot:CAMPEP_0202902308 /NCGR_PEP_ID=MMETSP1392-20130828/16779_1 /ASSEMBLY_ACC=CAM_ASM_000868 /TAXON_ID=225041 /ORGANISM="Chlamydomonas chlamydogama, Strain SAG 11-48b" /LENGTH=487 /DNA_ID=CAMNT_0049589057 /DNA_START=149 /DNA_END=1612 /DNA_ORIENTATION=+
MLQFSSHNSAEALGISPNENKVLVEYVWLGSSGSDLRSKTKVLDFKPASVEEVPVIVVDGSSYGIAAEDHEVYLKPRKIFRDPFRGGDHLLVLCDTFQPPQVDACSMMSFSQPVLQPHPSNNRAPCESVMKRAQASHPVFAIEQEYMIVAETPQVSLSSGGTSMHSAAQTTILPPGGWPHSHLPDPTQPFYFPVQHNTGVSDRPTVVGAAGRRLSEVHLKHCLAAGMKITEVSQKSTPSIWSYKLGPLAGIDLADELWMSRFVMLRLSEREGIPITFDPRAYRGGSSSLGCYLKYSTEETRQPGVGLIAIQQHVGRLQATHVQHLLAYGKGSLEKLQFSCGFGNKSAGIVVPSATLLNRAGCYVDRRPASNMDPYLVTMLLVSTTVSVPLPAPVVSQPSSNKSSGFSVASGCSFDSRPQSWCQAADSVCTSSWTSSRQTANSEDVLLDELEKLDCLAPDTPPNEKGLLASLVASSNDCYSDGTSRPH